MMNAWVRKPLWLAALVLTYLSSVVSATLPTGFNDADDLTANLTHPFPHLRYSGIKRTDKSVELRILSLGASIMSGTGSSTGNGLRKPLRDALRLDGWNVNMVGSLHGGTMVDNNHEAVPGDVLTQILARVPRSTGFKPNIVIINGGTDDANGPVDPASAGVRMNDVLNALWTADAMSATCIMLSTLIPTTNGNGMANQGTINDQYRALVKQRAAEGKCIYLAEMWPLGQQWLQFDTDYLATESPHVHPNDAGHAKMASIFYNSINWALGDNRVVAPGDFTSGPSTCPKVGGTGVDAGGLTQRGSGYDDGIYYHDSEEKGILWTVDSDWDRGQWKFARLFNRNYDDLVAWINKTSTSQVYAVWANSGDGQAKFTQATDMIPDLDCQYTSGVNFIDMNADGLDDLVYIDADGNAYLSINQGDGDRAAGKSPTFKRVSSTALIKSNEGYKREQVLLADIDGDGRGDYGVIDGQGNVYFWRNGWIDDIPKYWQALGQRFTGKNMGDPLGTRFEDINGDGRDDWVWLDSVGLGYIYTNGRSCAKGVEGNGLNVAWRQGFNHGESSGPAFKGIGGFVTDTEKVLRDRIHFARIYGQSTVFGNLPKQDYVFMQHTEVDGKHRFQMRVWKNSGAGGSKLLADGNKYCNMMGHSNGMVDYVWAYSFGRMEMWANRGKGTITDADPDGYWNYQGTIWTPPHDMDRRDLHLQDWDGDGTCDIIYADPNGGAVQVWINNYPKTGTWDWTYLSNPAPQLSCSQKRGLGLYDLAVRFADISGSGRADYLCIEPNSRTTGFIQNKDGSWTNAGQIKVSIDKDRANLRWADVNGDGADDLLWVEKFSGDAFVFYNQGPGNPSDLLGSSYSWGQQTERAYAGNSAGSCEFFTDIDGNGRADEHFILSTFNNEARTALSPSCGLQDTTGDDPNMTNVLPTVPGGSLPPGAGGGSGEVPDGLVYVPGDIWSTPHPTVGCIPPCTLVFPPHDISTTTITWPAITTSLWSKSGTVTTIFTTIIIINPFVVTEIPFWPVTIYTTDPTAGIITPKQSVLRPPFTTTMPSGEASIKTTVTVINGKTTTTPIPPTWSDGQHTESFQPMPTVSITQQPEPTVSYTRTHPTSTCAAHCGIRDCEHFGCIGGGGDKVCGTFGCLGGCGLFWRLWTFRVWWRRDSGGGGGGPGECRGDGCGCDPTKSVTSCGVLCTETVELTTIITGECRTTTCMITNCGTDTTATETTTTTAEEDFVITVIATDTAWEEDLTAAFATSVYNDFMSWWSVEDAAGDALSTSSTSVTQPTTSPQPTTQPPSTTTKPANSPTTTSTQVLAPSATALIRFAHNTYYIIGGDPDGSNDVSQDWAVFAVDYDNSDVDFCSDRYIYDQETKENMNLDKPYPGDDIGPFDISKFSLKSCTYHAVSQEELGYLTCGDKRMACGRANDAGIEYDCGGSIALAGVYCAW